jgi:C4-dicarboxylate-specific signal transduction histidine kinase
VERCKQAERKLREREAELAHMTRVVMMGELAASIAHEVNQPLTSIVIDGEIGLRKLARSNLDTETSRDLMRRIVANARRAAEIIARIRGMAAPQASQQMLQSIEEVIQESVTFLGHELQSRDVSVSLDLAPSLPSVLCDRTQLQQVVMNFAMNAVQAMASSPRRNIQVRTRLENSDTVWCTIEDSGPGIETKDLPHLFDRFFTTKDKGMGLGLAICRSIIEAHGGQIRADNNSTLGGARFGFTLPAVRAALD